ncbi:AAA family ATPase [Luteibacter sp. 3190]|uniref:AAA family ATPase n=1 Tax=Luteibacter sp. 3190 TaxID=2817736 RepID=UPI00285E5C75|nr:AAA family ATPase [Luteibacter sp. 3190]MDR6935707.1 DNA repair exonuclease SbcCD ATPase subunit [Luteibacter sp. 3190]
MTKLTTLTLSNIRRFGPEVTIDFSPGATVLLAPNGTGKTAVFESIELALTGSVARLQNDLTPLIRDGNDQAQVRLLLEENERVVQIDRNRPIQIHGTLEGVFGNTDQADLPFLLRLTHLLDQRERDWFVHAEAKAAGSQLAKLPIGRDGTQANSVLGSARRYLSDQLNQATERVNQAASELDEWHHLLRERDASAAELVRPLKSRAELSELLILAAETLPDIQLPALSGVESLATARDVLRQGISARLDRIDTRLTDLSSVAGLLSSFGAERDRVSRLQLDLAEVANGANAQRQEIARLSLGLSQRASQIGQVEQRRSDVAQRIARFAEEAKAKGELDRRTRELGEAGIELADAEAAIVTLRDRRQAIERVNQQHDNLRSKQQLLARTGHELSEAGKLVERWEAALKEAESTQRTLVMAQDQLQVTSATYQDAVASHARMERLEAEARGRLQAASLAADSMRQAVSMVAIHLTADRQDCPVCGVHHGAEELRQRVHESLSAIDPLLGAAERELQDAAEGLKRSEALVSETRAALQLARTAVSRAEGQRAALAAETDAIRANRLVAADTVASARQAIGDRAAQLSTAQRALSDELSAAPIPVPLDEFSQAKAALDVASQRLEGARLAAAEARVQLDHATRVYASARSGAEANASLQELSTAQLDIDRDLAALQAAYNSDSETLLRQQGQLSELESRAVEIEQQVAHAQSRLASIQNSWKQLSLPGDPSAEVAVAVEAQLTSEREVLERQSSQVEAIETEIVRWQKAEQNRLAESMLERRRGGTSESEVTAQLSKRVDDGMASVGHLAQMSRALEALSGRLSTEIGNIHDHVVAVVPLWRSLLKRIVRDQRFAQTDLDFYSHYKKEHASVLVPLHGTSVPVPSIASEAQMTDLQLTFLLSMAVRHHWCSWRALLLDDPTQHHDLVHAASVFDVLRDYIVDQGFQIVVATHDALQARFLMRKLQNDGIPSRLWTLTPTAKGVTAIAGK